MSSFAARQPIGLSIRRALALVALCLAACTAVPPAPTPADRSALAPTGALRVGVYPGSPVSMVRDARTGTPKGISVGMGQALADRLGVPFQRVEFSKLSEVIDAAREGRIDLLVTNGTPARARLVDFAGTLLEVEHGYLVPSDSPLTSAQAVDRPGVRVAVVQGSTSQGALPGVLRQASIVAAPSIESARTMLARHEAEAFATQKSILYEVADSTPGTRVLDGRYGVEQIATGIPKGRESGLPFLRAFVEQARAYGRVARLIEEVGLKGALVGDGAAAKP